MTIEREHLSKLLQAAELCDEVAKVLDIEGSACQHCGLVRRQNFVEFNAEAFLSGVVRKLRRTVSELKAQQ
jgi:predicted Zn-ribbon and HTH transcriptional regulator